MAVRVGASADAYAQVAALALELRRLAGKSQVEVAEAMGIAQGEVSRLEARSDSNLSTIQKYVKAPGFRVCRTGATPW